MTTGRNFRARDGGKLLWVLAVVVGCGRATAPTPSAPVAPPPPPPPAAQAPAAAPTEAEPEGYSFDDKATAPREYEEMRRNSATAHAERPDDLESAQAELERSRVELNRALAGPAPRPSSGGGAPAAASRGAAADAAPPAKAEKKSAESSCATACRAFASLERAASAVCRITGEKDGRCSHAHAVVSDAKQRVAVCTCTSE